MTVRTCPREARRFRPWLVIADNAGAVSDLSGLLGAACADEHVLITSRDPGWSAAARTIAVDVLPRAEAVALLQVRAPWRWAMTPGAREMQHDVLAGCRRVLGEDHPDTIAAASVLEEWSRVQP